MRTLATMGQFLRRNRGMLLGVCVSMLVLLAIASTLAVLSRPAMPNEWRRIRQGMPRAAALAELKDEVVDMRSLKGFDVINHPTTMIGSPSYWYLLLTYDGSNCVSRAQVGFVHRSCGLFNIQPTSIFSGP